MAIPFSIFSQPPGFLNGDFAFHFLGGANKQQLNSCEYSYNRDTMDAQAIGNELGEAGFTTLVAAFYKGVKNDDLLAPLYPDDDWEGAEKRLRDFLIFRFGLSNRYIEERGHPRLGMRHAPFAIGIAERDRWLELMGRAVEESVKESNVAESVARDLMAFFEHVAEFLRNRE